MFERNEVDWRLITIEFCLVMSSRFECYLRGNLFEFHMVLAIFMSINIIGIKGNTVCFTIVR